MAAYDNITPTKLSIFSTDNVLKSKSRKKIIAMKTLSRENEKKLGFATHILNILYKFVAN